MEPRKTSDRVAGKQTIGSRAQAGPSRYNRSHRRRPPTMEVRMDLAQIMISETRDQQLIVLPERNGQRVLPIVIGLTEALAIDRRVKGVTLQRPLTHDLLANVIESLQGELE